MAGYKIQQKVSANQAEDISIAAQYDAVGNDIELTYATKTELENGIDDVTGLIGYHMEDKSNPHGVTPKQIGAFPVTGGIVNGPVQATVFGSNVTSKDYVDFRSGSGASFGVGGESGRIYYLNNLLPKSGGTLTGEVTGTTIKARYFQMSDTSLNAVTFKTGTGVNFGFTGSTGTIYDMDGFSKTTHIHSLATEDNDGFMSADDKGKLDDLTSGCKRYRHLLRFETRNEHDGSQGAEDYCYMRAEIYDSNPNGYNSQTFFDKYGTMPLLVRGEAWNEGANTVYRDLILVRFAASNSMQYCHTDQEGNESWYNIQFPYTIDTVTEMA